MKRLFIFFICIVLMVFAVGCGGSLNDTIEISDVNGRLSGGIEFTLTNTSNKTITDIVIVVEHLSTTKGEYTEEIEISKLSPNTPKKFHTFEHGDSISSTITKIKRG